MQDASGNGARRLLAELSGAPHGSARAPGRVNVLGEHTDYNGGLVLPAALTHRTGVAVRLAGSSRVRGFSREEGPAEAELGAPPDGQWLDYVRGVARELSAVGRIPARGFDVAVAGEVPGGSGLSSSAALSVATALALAAALERPFAPGEGIEVARICQRAEADFVGVPCGILDPFAALMSRPGSLLLLDCARMEWDPVDLPSDLLLLIVDTGVQRELRGGAYAERRGECERALQLSSRALGRDLESLSSIAEEELLVLGRELPSPLHRRARHVVTENGRVRRFVAALRSRDLGEAGRALFSSHESLRDDFEVTCVESDHLVEASHSVEGILGARMTGAGFGGCTVHLVRAERADEAQAHLQSSFERRFGRSPRAWSTRPGPGAEVDEA
ncbi:MAG: galactokinase [Myxococcota bacterium]